MARTKTIGPVADVARYPVTAVSPLNFDYIDQHGFITDRDYTQLTDRAKATRTADFNKLIELGLIVRQGRDAAPITAAQ